MFKILNENSKWKNSSPMAERRPQLRKYLPDEKYLENLRFREPAFRFIIENFKINPSDILDCIKYPILLLGFYSTPLAIELSQWGYPTTLIVKTLEEIGRVKANSQRHAGNMRELFYYNYYVGVPASRIIVWVDDDYSIPEDRKLEWLKYLKTRCQFLIAAIKGDKLHEEITRSTKNAASYKKYGDYYLIINY